MAFRRGAVAQADIVQHLDCPYTVREVILRPDGQYGRIWAIPVYRIDGLDYWNVPLVLEALQGTRQVPDVVEALPQYVRDLTQLHPELVGADPLWVARSEGLKIIVQRAANWANDRGERPDEWAGQHGHACRFIHHLHQILADDACGQSGHQALVLADG